MKVMRSFNLQVGMESPNIYKSREPISNFYLKKKRFSKKFLGCPGCPQNAENYISYNNFLIMLSKVMKIVGP